MSLYHSFFHQIVFVQWIDHVLFFHSLVNRHLGCFSFELFWIMLLWTSAPKFLSRQMLSFRLGYWTGVDSQPGELQSMGLLRWTRLSDFTFTFHFHALEKEMANPLQCSCLENPRDRGAWWAAVYGVAQSGTRLKQLSSSSSSSSRLMGSFGNYVLTFWENSQSNYTKVTAKETLAPWKKSYD